MPKVTITAETLDTMESAVYALARHGDPLAWQLGSLVLLMRAESNLRAPRTFRCDVDESAGMAEVYELDQWSKRV